MKERKYAGCTAMHEPRCRRPAPTTGVRGISFTPGCLCKSTVLILHAVPEGVVDLHPCTETHVQVSPKVLYVEGCVASRGNLRNSR